MSTLDQLAGQQAARQLGLLTRAQALELGFTFEQIKQRLATGRWRLAARGVYAIAGAAATREQRVLAACLAGPSTTVASHLTAAYLFDLRPAPDRIHITVPSSSSGRGAGVVAHRTDLDRRDRVKVGVLPCTGVGRTLVDCAGLLDQRQLNTLVDDTLAKQLASRHSVQWAIDRAGPTRGKPKLLKALYAWEEGVRPGSPAEMRLLRRLVEWGFPPPVRQHELSLPEGRFRLDLAWPEIRVAIEYDGAAYHTPRHLCHDESRHVAIAAAGWILHRADKADLRPSSDRLLRELTASFARSQAA